MSIDSFLKQNPTFTEADVISDWCKPLSLLDIPYFCHAHLDKQNRLRFVCNYPEFARHYIQQGFYQYDVHMKAEFRQSQVIVWDLFERTEKSKIMHEDFMAFGRGHTFTVIQPSEDGCDYFHFAAEAGKFDMNQNYLHKLDALEQFISYYRDKLSRSKSVQNKLSMGLRLDPAQGGYSLVESLIPMDHQDFYQLTAHQRQHVQSGLGYLTMAEINCLYWLAQGKSMIETANMLGISGRTVKAHVHNAKDKLQCDNLFQLGMYFRDKYLLLSKTGWMPKEQET